MKWILAIFLFSTLASAKDLSLQAWQAGTVKVVSYPCLTTKPRFSGSGLLINYNGATWILTSEHVLIHDSSPATCHEVETAHGPVKASLIIADYMKGLALLKIASPVNGSINISDLQMKSQAASLTALGYPALSEQLQTLGGGVLVNSQSQSGLIAGVKSMIEASLLPVEFGMSGGVLLAGERFMGILSHQVLKRVPRQPTVVTEVTTPDMTDLALAIPAGEALAWFLQNTGGGKNPHWVRQASAQLRGQEAIAYGPLLFSMEQQKASDAWGIGGAFFGAIAKGGADGSGIGGPVDAPLPTPTPQPTNPEEINAVMVTIDPAAGPDLRGATLPIPELEKWRNWLLTGRKVEIVFLRDAGAKRLQPIDSLDQLLTSWLRDGHQPIAIRSTSGAEDSDAAKLRNAARTAIQLAQEARDKSEPESQRKAWLGILRDLAVLAQGGLASSKDVMAAATGDEYAGPWQDYYNDDFDSAKDVAHAFVQLAEQMQTMGL